VHWFDSHALPPPEKKTPGSDPGFFVLISKKVLPLAKGAHVNTHSTNPNSRNLVLKVSPIFYASMNVEANFTRLGRIKTPTCKGLWRASFHTELTIFTAVGKNCACLKRGVSQHGHPTHTRAHLRGDQ
jgi:hypothetical protein